MESSEPFEITVKISKTEKYTITATKDDMIEDVK